MEKHKKYTWHKIADSVTEIKFSENKLAELEIAGKKICVALHNDTIHACTHKCPHAGGYLADGYLDPFGNIVCPLHRYKYSLQSGRNTSGEGYFLKMFPVEIRPDGIFVELTDNNLFNR